MKRSEYKRLLALAKKMIREGERNWNRARRKSKNAGHSSTPDGTGDEGWRQMIEGYSSGSALVYSGERLISLIDEMDIDAPRTRGGR